MKKIALILALILSLSPLLVSCNKVEQTAETTAVKTDEEYEYSLDDIPELDFGKQQFGIYGINGTMSYFIAEEETGDLVNDAIFQRNITIEERYNLEFNSYEEDRSVGVDKLKTLIMSGDKTYHMYQSTQHNGMPALILNNYFVDWNELDAVRLYNPYWNSKGVKNLGFNGKD